MNAKLYSLSARQAAALRALCKRYLRTGRDLCIYLRPAIVKNAGLEFGVAPVLLKGPDPPGQPPQRNLK